MHEILIIYEGHSKIKESFAIKKYLLIIGKKKHMQDLSHTFTYFSTLRHLSYRDTSLLISSSYQTAAWLFNQSTVPKVHQFYGIANVR
jgi:hypothetical protein